MKLVQVIPTLADNCDDQNWNSFQISWWSFREIPTTGVYSGCPVMGLLIFKKINVDQAVRRSITWSEYQAWTTFHSFGLKWWQIETLGYPLLSKLELILLKEPVNNWSPKEITWSSWEISKTVLWWTKFFHPLKSPLRYTTY